MSYFRPIEHQVIKNKILSFLSDGTDSIKQTVTQYLIKSSSQSPAVMERWVLKVQALEEKKRHYEGVLQRELDGLDDEFSFLKLLSQELQVRAKSIRSQRFQQRAA